MSVKVIKVETNEYKVLVKIGDEALARKEAVKAAISAEAARLSAIAADESEQVAIEKAAQALEDAADALASKQDAESAATASEGFATDSGISATASNAAKGLSEAAKEIAIEEAGKSGTSAGQSAASAAAAEAAKNLILNKAEVNITTAGHVLLADGSKFKSVSQVEFLRNKDAFARSFAGGIFDLSNLIIHDSFNRANSSTLGIADSGQTWSNLVGNGFDVFNNAANPKTNGNISIINSGGGSLTALVGIRMGIINNNQGVVFGKDSANYYRLSVRTNEFRIDVVKNNILTNLASIILNTKYSTDWPGNFSLATDFKNLNFQFSIYFFSPNRILLSISLKDFPFVLNFDATSLNDFILQESDIAFFGIFSNATARFINNVSVFKA